MYIMTVVRQLTQTSCF